jgi:hypothetical protein
MFDAWIPPSNTRLLDTLNSYHDQETCMAEKKSKPRDRVDIYISGAPIIVELFSKRKITPGLCIV